MTSDPAFAAVDWGTSSFRLWLMGADGTVLAERRSQQGMLVSAKEGFATVLGAHLAAVDARDGLPAVICGMAGSRQGWIEARYLDVPAALSSIVDNAVTVPGLSRSTSILPGLAQRDVECADVMRGEETQLLGATALTGAHDGGLYCMPGTHSKWVRIESGRVSGFSTFMTGECFSLLAQHSILARTVDGGTFEPDDTAFAEAVAEGHRNPDRLTNLLFSVRARQLLYADLPETAAACLSGFLIGAELAGSGCARRNGSPVILVVSGKLGPLYRAAFAALGVDAVTVDADEAVRAGLLHAAGRLGYINPRRLHA